MATTKKATTAKKPAAKPAAKKPAPKKAEVKKVVLVATKVTMYHPYLKQYIPVGPPGIEVEKVDSWLESQLAVGLLKEV